MLSIVIPVLRDDAALERLLPGLQDGMRAVSSTPEIDHQVWVVDGAGSAQTQEIARAYAARYLSTCASRGAQIAAGVAQADGDWCWVLHADTVLPPGVIAYVKALATSSAPAWGRFDVQLEGLSVIAWFMNQRSRLTKICTGDQAMFVHRSLLAASGGFPEQPLMEDVEVSVRLKRYCTEQFTAPRLSVVANPRRWQRHGVIRTVLTMWLFRWRYWRGADPEELYQDYYRPRD